MDRHMAAPRATPITLFSTSYNWVGSVYLFFHSLGHLPSISQAPTLLILLNHTG